MIIILLPISHHFKTFKLQIRALKLEPLYAVLALSLFTIIILLFNLFILVFIIIIKHCYFTIYFFVIYLILILPIHQLSVAIFLDR